MTGKEITMTVQGQARAGEIADRGVAGVKSGKTPGVPETPPPGPGCGSRTRCSPRIQPSCGMPSC